MTSPQVSVIIASIYYIISSSWPLPIKVNASKGADAKPRVYVVRWQIAVSEKLSASRTAGLPKIGHEKRAVQANRHGSMFFAVKPFR